MKSGLSRIAGIVLAAGASQRLGRPKQLVVLAGETLLERAVRVAIETGLEPVYVVVSGELELALGKLAGCTVLLNERASEGMAASIRVGASAAAAAGVDGVVVMACDQPAVTVEHVRRLTLGGIEVMASEYAGKRGVPAYFPAAQLERLTQLTGDVGARDLLRGVRTVELRGGELDVDTVAELERAREIYEPSSS